VVVHSNPHTAKLGARRPTGRRGPPRPRRDGGDVLACSHRPFRVACASASGAARRPILSTAGLGCHA
jgi:hypothetical protein